VFLVVGLGNPGEQYSGNRHNIGFMVLDEIGKRRGVTFRANKTGAALADVVEDSARMLLAKPQSFMNNSGQDVRSVLAYFKIPTDRLIVVHDDMDIPFGEIKVKMGGGSAGHKGVQSVMDCLSEPDFYRVRCGVGRPPGRMDAADYVLRDFTAAERQELPAVVDYAADLAEQIVVNNIKD